MKNNLIAHTSEDGRTQSLKNHSNAVAALARKFAEPFGCGDEAEYVGSLHDIGKATDGFQNYILDPLNAPMSPHSVLGATVASFNGGNTARMDGLIIAGHHGGLSSYGNVEEQISDVIANRKNDVVAVAVKAKNEKIVHPTVNAVPSTGMEAFIRTKMLFSCLVDADYLDTAAFMRGREVSQSYDSMEILFQRYMDYVQPWIEAADVNRQKKSIKKNEEINIMRTDMMLESIKAGSLSHKGEIRKMSIPTGGAKTVSSFGYALAAAKADPDIKHIIVAIPYTSIITQTAEVARDIFGGEENVLEHHSSVDFKNDSNGLKMRLASENWDSPIIITTNVQLFESLFSSKPGKTRKLHNLANSVIIFDEAQLLPSEYLKPCLSAVEVLANQYGARIVLCTATQPPLERFLKAPPKEIISDVQRFRKPFERCAIKDIGTINIESLVNLVLAHNQCLCVVNYKGEAKYIYDILKNVSKEKVYCLTTNLTPKDRERILSQIKNDLLNGIGCQVISTSLIECGVNLDFPIGFRELTGLDSVYQIAGRVNRNGKLDANKCVCYMFDGPAKEYQRANGKAPISRGELLSRQQATLAALAKNPIYSPAAIGSYFTTLYTYAANGVDAKDIIGMINKRNIDYREVNASVKIIDNDTVSIVIPAVAILQIITNIKSGKVEKVDIRMLGRYSVTVYCNEYDTYWRNRTTPIIIDDSGITNMCVLDNPGDYDADIGLWVK